MFDPQSAALLQSAPEIPGVLPEELPRLLTAIYTQLVTNRLNNLNADQDAASVTKLIEIATSYEIITAIQPNFIGRGAAAFVAGSAYQILSKSISAVDQDNEAPLSRDHIDGKIAAALLFLVAEQYPDAHEAIGALNINRDLMPISLQMLAESLRDMVKENFSAILERRARRAQLPESKVHDTQTRAMLYLYDRILQGVEIMAARVMGKEEQPVVVGEPNLSALELFESVIEMASQRFKNVPFTRGFLSTYPGPAHLASLLQKSASTLLDASIMRLPAPTGTDADIWQNWLRFRTKSKPILWPNHRDAFERGFHLLGNSAVMVLPTGSGKTTLSEFKIAATLASGKKVIFLAPTNALVEQLKVDLSQNLPSELFGSDEFFELDLFVTVDDTLSMLEVMTPEKCLAMLNFSSVAFEEVGLLVFDECHSLASDSGSLRRSVDGMLVILTLQHFVPDVDLLFLSAMLENGEEFAGWVAKLTGRKCLSINTVWKPSRQARGIIIYPESEISEVQEAASKAQHMADRAYKAANKKLSKGPLTVAASLVSATPHALFGLINNWHPNSPEDIRIRRLSKTPCLLKPKFGANRSIEATPSGNDIARNLAISCAMAGLKTIVFINNANWTYSSAKKIDVLVDGNITYNDREQRLWSSIETEFGNPESSMLYGIKRAVPHNANLIGFERQLSENLFKRPDGASVIFATTTLSQGMNLPAQVAILSANERASMEGEYVTQEPLKPHELLNAAGRAGRAGYLANGMVILIPRTILTFRHELPQAEAENILRSIIPENERCVILDDPLQKVLDQIQDGVAPSADIEYIFHRMSEVQDGKSLADLTFNRSFAAYRAKQQGNEIEFTKDVERFKMAMSLRPIPRELPDWLVQIAIQSGISPLILQSLYMAVKIEFDDLPITIEGWVNWLIKWFEHNEDAGHYCFGMDMLPLRTVAGLEFINHENYGAALDSLRRGIIPWLNGLPIVEIERKMSGEISGAKLLCPKSREIITNIAPRGFSFFSGFLVQITKEISNELEELIKYPAALECLPAAISRGFDQPEKLAFYQLADDPYLSRVEAHQRFKFLHPQLKCDESDDYKRVMDAMRSL